MEHYICARDVKLRVRVVLRAQAVRRHHVTTVSGSLMSLQHNITQRGLSCWIRYIDYFVRSVNPCRANGVAFDCR